MAVLRTNFLSRSLGRQTELNVIIPTYQFRHNNSEKSPYDLSRKFKVLILLHGFSGDCNDYLSFTNIARYAEQHDLAVIMPSGYNSGYVDDPDGAKVHSFIAHELLEVCSFLFPISIQREDVVVGGLSMGAMGAARIALAHPEIFGEVLMLSGAPLPLQKEKHIMDWFGRNNLYYSGSMPGTTIEYQKTQEDAFHQAKKNLLENKPLPRFTMSVGTEDQMLAICQHFYAYMSELGYDISLTEVQGYGHQWDFWDSELRSYIENKSPLTT